MALSRSIGARPDAVRGTAALEVRRGLERLFTGPGVLPGAASPLVTGTSGWAYQVGSAGFVTRRAIGDGLHLLANDGLTATPSVSPSPGSGLSRIDIVWVRQPSADENGDTTSEPEFGVTQGVAAAQPNPPALPAGVTELARNVMTSSATSTGSSGNTITQTAAQADLVRRDGVVEWQTLTPIASWNASTVQAALMPDGVTVRLRGYLRPASGTIPGENSSGGLVTLPTELRPGRPPAWPTVGGNPAPVPFPAIAWISGNALPYRAFASLNINPTTGAVGIHNLNTGPVTGIMFDVTYVRV